VEIKTVFLTDMQGKPKFLLSSHILTLEEFTNISK